MQNLESDKSSRQDVINACSNIYDALAFLQTHFPNDERIDEMLDCLGGIMEDQDIEMDVIG
jgi:hypothetical protein